jgi:hypothetical protein
MIDINKEAEEYAELNQYDLSEHDEGGYLGINEKTFAKHLIEFATNSKATQAKIIQAQIEVLQSIDVPMFGYVTNEIFIKINELKQQLKNLEL